MLRSLLKIILAYYMLIVHILCLYFRYISFLGEYDSFHCLLLLIFGASRFPPNDLCVFHWYVLTASSACLLIRLRLYFLYYMMCLFSPSCAIFMHIRPLVVCKESTSVASSPHLDSFSLFSFNDTASAIYCTCRFFLFFSPLNFFQIRII